MNNDLGSSKLKYMQASGFVANDFSIVKQSYAGYSDADTGRFIGISKFQFDHSYLRSGLLYIILFMLSKLMKCLISKSINSGSLLD